MHLAIKAIAFAEAALHGRVYLCMEIPACEHMYRCLFAHPASRLTIQKRLILIITEYF